MSENITMENINDNSSISNEVKKIDLYWLVENYKKRTSIKMKEEFLKSQIKVVPYLGYGTKMFLANNIIEQCCLRNNDVYVDSCKKYILYIYTLLKYWTNIDIKENDLLIQYDLLDQNYMIEKILELIPEKEIVTFSTILDIKEKDLYSNKCGVQAFISNKINEFYPELSKTIMPLIENLSNKLNTLDIDKVEKMLNKIVKFVS